METSYTDYPGTAQHQAALKAIVAHYADDRRMLAVVVFGSLGRGDWDALSDIDLDIVLSEEAEIDVPQESQRLVDALAASGEQAALVIPQGPEEVDIVFASLLQLSIRYHPLHSTNPFILNSMRVLAGRIDLEAIVSAGSANRKAEDEPLERLVDRFVRYAAVADIGLQRGRLWSAIEVLQRMRNLLMIVFTRTHGGSRGYRFFEAEADGELQARLGATLPAFSPASAQAALLRLMDILETDLGSIANGQLSLNDRQWALLARLRQNQARQQSEAER